MKCIALFVFLSFLIFKDASAQQPNVIGDDGRNVPEYKTPDVLTRFNFGGKVKSAKVWYKKQRPDILKNSPMRFTERFPGN